MHRVVRYRRASRAVLVAVYARQFPPVCSLATHGVPVPEGAAAAAAQRPNVRIKLHGSEWKEDPAWASPLGEADRRLALTELTAFVKASKRLLVITGAGVSTASGIPDYRGPKGSYRLGHKPMSHQEFTGEARHRQRYWARSMVGFKKFDDVAPNRAHAALALLEQHGKLEALITQNVDGLHQRAGHSKVVDLHGRVDVVKCLSCGARDLPRAQVQEELEAKNSGWMAAHLLRRSRASQQQQEEKDEGTQQRADGDAELGPDAHYASFQVPLCPSCGSGLLKPDVVFFGDNVPKATVQQCADHVDAADAVLVVGSSLEVYSAYRLVARCLEARKVSTSADLPTTASSVSAVAGTAGATAAPSSAQPLLKGALPSARSHGLSASKPPGSLRPTKPLCIVNLGETRAERSGAAPLLKVNLPCDEALWSLVETMGLVAADK